jgi:hypothetical protein
VCLKPGCTLDHVQIGNDHLCIGHLVTHPAQLSRLEAETQLRAAQLDYLGTLLSMRRHPNVPFSCAVVHIPGGRSSDCPGARKLQEDGSMVCDTCSKRYLPPGAT